MKIDLYEKLWMYAVGVMLALFFVSLANGAAREGRHPPSHVETIDPATVMKDERFRTQGVRVDGAGRVHAWVLGLMFVWLPAEMVLPADTPVTFHLTAVDVTHGYQIVRTNGQTMVLPGYISQFTTTFDAGEYLVACNEYCGLGHHTMAAKIRVVPKGEWTAPATTAAANPATGAEVTHASH
jgi:cytochrome c oxidase subunit 2